MREKPKKNTAIERKLDGKQKNFYARVSEIKKALFLHQSMIVLLYKKAFLNTNEFDPTLPSFITSLLQEYEDVVYLQSEGLSIRLILCPVQPFQVNQSIRTIRRRPRNFKGRFRN